MNEARRARLASGQLGCCSLWLPRNALADRAGGTKRALENNKRRCRKKGKSKSRSRAGRVRQSPVPMTTLPIATAISPINLCAIIDMLDRLD